MADNNDDNDRKERGEAFDGNSTSKKSKSIKKQKRKMSASEYQKYIVMEQGTMEIDSQGNPHLAEQEQEPSMLVRLPSWLLISETVSSVSSKQDDDDDDDDLGDAYVSMASEKEQKQQEHLQKEYMHETTRWQRWKAEACDIIHELIHYGKNKSWKKKILTGTAHVVGECLVILYSSSLCLLTIYHSLSVY